MGESVADSLELDLRLTRPSCSTRFARHDFQKIPRMLRETELVGLMSAIVSGYSCTDALSRVCNVTAICCLSKSFDHPWAKASETVGGSVLAAFRNRWPRIICLQASQSVCQGGSEQRLEKAAAGAVKKELETIFPCSCRQPPAERRYFPGHLKSANHDVNDV